MTVETERALVQQRVLRALDQQGADVEGSELFRAFVRETVSRIRGPFLAQHPPRQVLQVLQEGFRFLRAHRPAEVGVEVRPGPTRGIEVFACLDDQPFIVDTIRLFLRRRGADFWGGFHVIVRTERDAEGRLIAVGPECSRAESLSAVEADEGTLTDLADGTQELRDMLELARLTVRDFKPMVRAVERVMERCEGLAERRPDRAAVYQETAAFLKWLLRDNFVFMGLRSPDVTLGTESSDGPFGGMIGAGWVEPHWPGTVRVRKSLQESPIHRNGRIDEILVTLDPEATEGDDLFLRGLFTYRAVSHPSRNVPILRGVLRDVLEAQQADPGSFRYKGIANVFDSLPTEFLFTTPREAISQMVELVLDSETQQEVGVTVLRNEDGSAFCLMSMPKSFYSEDLRREIEREIHALLRPTYVDHGLFVGRFDTLLLHDYLTGLGDGSDATLQTFIERVRALATPWTSRLWQEAADREGEERADYLVDAFGRAFPETYTRRTPVDRALRDIRHLDSLSQGGAVSADLFEEGDGEVILRVYQRHDVYLTELLPIIDHFGLIVRSSEVVEVRCPGGTLQFDSLRLEVTGDDRGRLFQHRERFLEALPAVFGKLVDDDPLNALVVTAGLDWTAVDVVRAYLRYMRQIQVPVSLPRLQAIVLDRPDLVARLHALFVARFDPDVPDRATAVEEALDHVDELLRRIHAHDQDVVFGGLRDLVLATERTNAFRTDREGHYLSLKLAGARVRDMRGARPLYEIYVHSREVEGVHLRFGRVARGGLRWSDRADYRTEILGLVTTQQVKNVVIVPEGSKGGFYLRTPERGGDAQRRQADRLYATFIRGLLDLTDDVVDEQVVHPPRVVVHDGDDPYLVVAADKGTAHLSDTANALSLGRGYWLGDAFASGGSQGYDHKVVGITARGAWVLVRRHFAELGRDPYTQPFTCIGIGDMGGDVFGNGLLASRTTRLVAAFNHLHVFLDPDPDPEVSFAERQRLFAAGGREGGWDRYDAAKLSPGGGVFDRGAKEMELSPQVRELLGLDQATARPEDVIQAILRLDADLLWCGGIGTYVKATGESDADVDDRSNDRFRITASRLRVRIVGEGANLALTQDARIEANRRGVLLNTDFIDNSGGVDLSDHEVNLKILLRAPVARGELSVDDRNALLASLTEDVAALVLADNDTQGRQITRDVIRAQADVFPFARAIAFVERVFGVGREVLRLPTDEELEQRAAQDEGLTRPELAVLSSWVKRYVYRELVASGRARELHGYATFLLGYFPAALRERFRADIEAHQLADEIAMTVVTTRVVGDAGAAFVPLAVEETGQGVFAVCQAYLEAQRLARAYEVRGVLEELRTSVALHALSRAWTQVDAGCRDVVSQWLSPGLRVPTPAEIVEMEEAVDKVFELQADDVVRRNASVIAAMEADDIPADAARVVVKASYLNIALMAWWHARKLGTSLRDAAIVQLAAGRASRLQEVIDALRDRPSTGEWEPLAVHILVNRFIRLLRELVLGLGKRTEVESVDILEPQLVAGPLADVRRQVDAVLPAEGAPDLATLLVLEERVAGAVARVRPEGIGYRERGPQASPG
ncbi:MAG: NAD-glutamate dehydrogenase [Alphaproteobacteria bacterium]|nr:NAD-glutamate dehydrogenase [Alphaproteobacteria bacterium]